MPPGRVPCLSFALSLDRPAPSDTVIRFRYFMGQGVPQTIIHMPTCMSVPACETVAFLYVRTQFYNPQLTQIQFTAYNEVSSRWAWVTIE